MEKAKKTKAKEVNTEISIYIYNIQGVMCKNHVSRMIIREKINVFALKSS